jgi:hypothetical protein
MEATGHPKQHSLIGLIDRHAIFFSLLMFLLIFLCADHVLNEYYLPDAKGIENSYYHHGLRKNYSGSVSWGQEKHPLYTNDLGFKDSRNITVPRKTEQHRVLFIGDSFTEQTFAGMFRQAFPSLDILNAGVVSFSPKLMLYRLKHLLEIEQLHFDELILFIDISDINDEIEYSVWTPVEESPLRRLDSWLRSVSFSYKILRKSLLDVEKNQLLQQLIQRIDRGKVVLSQQPTIQENQSEKSQQVASPKADIAPSRPPQVRMPSDFREKRVEERPRWTFDQKIFEKWGRDGMALAQYHMAQIIQLMKQENVTVTIAVYPWPDQIREGDRYSVQEKEWRRFAELHGIGFLSYFEDFVQGNAEEVIGRYFIPGDVHWNEQGHGLIFQKVRDYYKNVPRKKQ